MSPRGRKDASGWQSPRFQNERSRGCGKLYSIPVFLGAFIASQSLEWVWRNTPGGPGATSLCVKAPEYKSGCFDLENRAWEDFKKVAVTRLCRICNGSTCRMTVQFAKYFHCGNGNVRGGVSGVWI